MDVIFYFLVIAAALIAIWRVLRRVTVFEYERGLKYVKGVFKEILEPGQHWYVSVFTTVRKIDVRPKFITLPGQEVLSADGVTLKVSLAASYEVENPSVAVNDVQDFEAALYLHLQIALRDIIGTATAETLLEQRDTFGPRILEKTAQVAAELGLKLNVVDMKDIMFPGQLKQIFSQVVAARKEGEAALERARGEDAALRKLANTAKLLEGNPSLMQLRLLQAVGESSGNTIMLEMPQEGDAAPARKSAAKTKTKAKRRAARQK